MKYMRYLPDEGNDGTVYLCRSVEAVYRGIDMEISSGNKKTHVINGTDIVLRLMKEDDTDLIIKWRNTEFVRRNFIYQELFTRQGHENWIRTMIDTGKVIQFIILRKTDDKPVGSVYLRDIDRTHNKAEYGIFIGEKEALGQGYGTQAAQMMIEYAFHEVGLHKLMLRVLAENERARRSYEKAGFIREAYLKDEVFLEGRYQDVIYMAVINDKGQEAFA